MTVLVIGEFRFPVENLEKAREPMARVIAATRAEAGCELYSFAEDVIEPGLFRISERWSSRAALDAHFATPHMKIWQDEREALGLHGRRLSIITVGSEDTV